MTIIPARLVELETQLAALYRLADRTDRQDEQEQKLRDEYVDIKDDLGLCYQSGCRTAVDRNAYCPNHRARGYDEYDDEEGV